MGRHDALTLGFEKLSVGVGIFDVTQKLVFCNQPFRTLRGYPVSLCVDGVSLETLLRFNAERGDFGPGDVEVQVADRIAEIEQSGEREIEREMADGQILSIRYQDLEDGGLAVTFEDKTEERRAQAALAASEERYALVADAAEEAIYEWNIEKELFFGSPKIEEMLGIKYQKDGFRDWNWTGLIHPEDVDRYNVTLKDHLSSELLRWECEYRIRFQDGEYHCISDHGTLVRSDTGEAVRLIAAVRDTTDLKAAEQALADKEAQLRIVLDSMPGALVYTDEDLNIVLCNDRFMEAFSAQRDLLQPGRPYLDLLYYLAREGAYGEGDVETLVAERTESLKNPSDETFETRTADGRVYHVRRQRVAAGGTVTVATDFTEHKLAEEKLAEKEAQLRLALDNMPGGMVLCDRDLRYVFANSQYSELCNYPDDLLTIGGSTYDIIRFQADRGDYGPGDPHELTQELVEMHRNVEAVNYERNFVGSDRTVQIYLAPTPEGGYVSIITDITEHKEAERALRDREAQLTAALQEFNAVLDTIKYGVLFMGPDLNARIINRAFGEIWGVAQEFIDGSPSMHELMEYNKETGLYNVPPEEWDQWIESRVEAVHKGSIAPMEMHRADGKVLQYQCIALPDGGRMLTYFDITELKEREADLIEARDAAETALRDLEVAQERLIQSEKMASLGQLTAGIAHEIKNPLNFVNNFAKLSSELLGELADVLTDPIAALAEDARDDARDLFETVKGNLEKIDEHGRRADAIVKNMLLHSREGPSEMRRTSLNAIAEEALNLAYHGARAENSNFNIEMLTALDEGVGEIDCYPQDLMRVFLNVASNGMYAANKRKAEAIDPNSAPKPTISVTTREEGNTVSVEIRDNGSGIPDDIREKIFTPFFTTKPAGEGTGLGLSLSYDIVVKQHGGTMRVDSEPGKFTAFIVTLPRVAAAETAKQEGSS